MQEACLMLDWSGLTSDQIADRLGWLRANLEAGVDWGYSPEVLTCVLMTRSAAMSYKLCWFSPGQQVEIDHPSHLLGIYKSQEKDPSKDVW